MSRHLESPQFRWMCTRSAHETFSFWSVCNGVISQLKSGKWRVQVRYKGRYASQSFKRKCDADSWAKQTEIDIDNGKTPSSRVRTEARTFGDLIDLHLDDLADTGKRRVQHRLPWRPHARPVVRLQIRGLRASLAPNASARVSDQDTSK